VIYRAIAPKRKSVAMYVEGNVQADMFAHGQCYLQMNFGERISDSVICHNSFGQETKTASENQE
jgi:hypothetical protein